MGEIYLKILKGCVAVCDKELIGNVYEEGKKVIDLKKHAEFYKGEICGKERVKKELERATSINLVGKKAVGIGIELGLIKKENVIEIAGVPHAQAYKIKI